MRGGRPLLLGAVLAAGLAGCLAGSGTRPAMPAPDPNAPPTPCELCHFDVQMAFAATRHAKEGHACATCHGRSAAHSWSEDGHVPPTRLLGTRAQVDPWCTTCHKDYQHPPPLQLRTRCSVCHDPHPHEKDEETEARVRSHRDVADGA